MKARPTTKSSPSASLHALNTDWSASQCGPDSEIRRVTASISRAACAEALRVCDRDGGTAGGGSLRMPEGSPSRWPASAPNFTDFGGEALRLRLGGRDDGCLDGSRGSACAESSRVGERLRPGVDGAKTRPKWNAGASYVDAVGLAELAHLPKASETVLEGGTVE